MPSLNSEREIVHNTRGRLALSHYGQPLQQLAHLLDTIQNGASREELLPSEHLLELKQLSSRDQLSLWSQSRVSTCSKQPRWGSQSAYPGQTTTEDT